MLVHCLSCDRSFVNQQALDQHKQYSAAHKRSLLESSSIQTAPKLQPQSLNHGITGLSEPDTITSSSSTSQVTDDAKANISPVKGNHWSVIPNSQQQELFEALLVHCHLPEQLLGNKYLLHPYTDEDLAGLRRCKNCGSRS
jgi:hypothetical protein